jgi:hypothetical protein
MSLWRLFVLAILVLLFRRLPVILMAYKFTPAIHNFREAVFTGWFGPMGVGALFYYTVAIEQFDPEGPDAHARSVVKPIVYFMILASVIVHGNTIPMFYLGTFATRTLTRTSLSSSGGNSVTRLPKLVFGQDVFLRQSRDQREAANSTPLATTIEVSQIPRQTAITIVTPEDIRDRSAYHRSESPSIIGSSTCLSQGGSGAGSLSPNSPSSTDHDAGRSSQLSTSYDNPGRLSTDALDDII